MRPNPSAAFSYQSAHGADTPARSSVQGAASEPPITSCDIHDAWGQFAHSTTQPFGCRNRHTMPAGAGAAAAATRTARNLPAGTGFFPPARGAPDSPCGPVDD